MSGLSTFSVDQFVHERDVVVLHGAEPFGIGPVVVSLQRGTLATPVGVCGCDELRGRIGVTPGRVGAVTFVQLQLDITHGQTIAASFALALDDFATLIDRLRAALELARFEASHGAGGGSG